MDPIFPQKLITAPSRKLMLGVLLLLAMAPASWAKDRAACLSVGTASRLALDSPFDTVIVGDQLIIQVRTDDDRSVVIEPLKPGVTNLVFVDTRGLVIANVRLMVCASFGSVS
ncbi:MULTISPECIES: pilus assembly protein N-terminal domain-containing protein [unclassified Bradyrhizobium]